jgi:SNF2 family DNA or RNA helicase
MPHLQRQEASDFTVLQAVLRQGSHYRGYEEGIAMKLRIWLTAIILITLPGFLWVWVKPFKHQSDVLALCKDADQFAVFWEQGTGKTRLMLDNAVHLAHRGEIDCVLVLAPNGVHRTWIEDEVPKHLGNGTHAVYYTSDKAGTIKHRRMLHDALQQPFFILAMSYDAFMTMKGKKFIKQMFKRKVLMILDESTAIKTPSAKRTRAVVLAGKQIIYKRILTGTPVANNPFDLYTQMRFLDTLFWKERGFGTFTEFKNYFGIWQRGYNAEQNREFDYVVGFRNLDRLYKMIQEVSSRVTKDEVLDLPPKLYSKRYFDLTPEMKRVYNEVRDEAMTFLSSGDLITAPLAITRMLRLHQVTSNYLPTEVHPNTGEILKYTDIDKHNPRLACLNATLQEVHHQAIIWARFRRDIDLITEMLGDAAVRYDGKVNSDDRVEAIRQFQSGDAQWFVGNPAAGGLGLTLTAARSVIYYNNSFRLVDRLQSEDRAHRIGQAHPVEYIDLVATGTIDNYIIGALRSKVNIAATITGDQLKEWI